MGIGKAVAELFAREGAKVVLAARSKDALEALAKELPGSFAITTDMTKKADIEKMIDETVKKFGRVDILINNAGRGIYGAVENVSIDEYKNIFELNVIGPLIAMQKVIPIMRKQGGGAIVNISSMVSKNYLPHLGAYASTKFALNSLSLTARNELEKDNIIVSLMFPTLTETNFGKNAVKTDTLAEQMAPRSRPDRPSPDSAEFIAERIKFAIESGKAEIYPRDEMAKWTMN